MFGSENKRSPLILIGGAEEKTGNKDVLKEVVKISNASSIAVVPTASGYPDEVFRNYDYAFRDLGVKEVFNFDVRYKNEADKPDYFEKLEKCNLVFFGGGDQVKLVEMFDGTKLLSEIKTRFFSGNLCVAGTSAGAAAASDPMLYDGDYNSFQKGTVRTGRGLGFINGITIDTHFFNRERIPRLTQYLSAGYGIKGIGIDEDTGIAISPDLKFEVFGSGMVTLINYDRVTYSNFNSMDDKQKFSIHNLRFGFLAAGAMFSLKRWVVIKNTETKKKEVKELDMFKNSFSLNS